MVEIARAFQPLKFQDINWFDHCASPEQPASTHFDLHPFTHTELRIQVAQKLFLRNKSFTERLFSSNGPRTPPNSVRKQS